MITFTLDPATVVQFAVAFVLPLLVGLVTTRVTHGGIKAVLLAGLTLVSSLLVELGESIVAGTVFDLGHALMLALPAFVVSVATHFGLWKPTGLADKAQGVGDSAPYGEVPNDATRAEVEDPDDVEESDDPVPTESSTSYLTSDPNGKALS